MYLTSSWTIQWNEIYTFSSPQPYLHTTIFTNKLPTTTIYQFLVHTWRCNELIRSTIAFCLDLQTLISTCLLWTRSQKQRIYCTIWNQFCLKKFLEIAWFLIRNQNDCTAVSSWKMSCNILDSAKFDENIFRQALELHFIGNLYIIDISLYKMRY